MNFKNLKKNKVLACVVLGLFFGTFVALLPWISLIILAGIVIGLLFFWSVDQF